MKCKLSLLFTGAVVAFLLLVSAAAQNQTESLGDYARAVRKNKPAHSSAAAKVYDNDNLPVTSTLSIVGNTSGQSDNAQEDGAGKTATDQAKDSTGPASAAEKSEKQPEIKPEQSAEEREKAVGEWKKKIDAQKASVDLASRELDVMQQEYRVKEAEFYANTASRVQNPYGFAVDDTKYQSQISDRQKRLDDAKQKLSDLQDEARKAGAPNSAIE
jgi:hypothetical protein